MIQKILFLKKVYLFSQPADNYLCSQPADICQLVTSCSPEVHLLPAGRQKVHPLQHDIQVWYLYGREYHETYRSNSSSLTGDNYHCYLLFKYSSLKLGIKSQPGDIMVHCPNSLGSPLAGISPLQGNVSPELCSTGKSILYCWSLTQIDHHPMLTPITPYYYHMMLITIPCWSSFHSHHHATQAIVVNGMLIIR